jgi:soluble lytic murein transglycosylase-like protein
MDFAGRRSGDRRQPARSPSGSAENNRGRRSARVRRFTRAGLAAALAVMSRHTERLLPEGRAQVEVETGNFHVPDYDRGDLEELIEEAAAAHGISPHLVRAVVEAESGFDPWSVSPAGAQGLMQLMPDTAALMGVDDRLDPRQNVFGGAKYLSQLLDRFDGDVALALAGYNAGPTKVARYRGIPPYRETRGYVARIRRLLGRPRARCFPAETSRPVGPDRRRAAGGHPPAEERASVGPWPRTTRMRSSPGKRP